MPMHERACNESKTSRKPHNNAQTPGANTRHPPPHRGLHDGHLLALLGAAHVRRQHDDLDREHVYERDTQVGRLARALDAAPHRKWLVVSMKNDWSRIFA